MTDRILTRTNLLILAIIAAMLHAAAGVLPYFFNFSAIAWTLFDVPLLILAVFFVLYIGKNQTPIRFQGAQTLLILFFVWLLVSCLSMTVTYHNDWTGYNSERMLNTVVSLFLCFPLGVALARMKKPAAGKWLLHAAFLVWSVFILWALIVVFQGKTAKLPNGGTVCMNELFSLELNCNSNITGCWEMLVFMGCCYMALRSKKAGGKALYVVFAVLHYIALVLSNSRASVFAALTGFSAMAGVAAYLRLKRFSAARRILAAVAIGLAAGAVFYLLRSAVFRLFAASSNAGAEAAQGARDITSGQTSKDAFSSRLKIWRCTLDGITNSFRSLVFGYSPNSVPYMISLFSNGKYNDMYSHNQFLEITAAMGIPGLCLFLAWLVLIVRDMFRLLAQKKTFLLGIPVIILVLLLANMAEAHLVFYHFLGGYFFFFLCGILHGAVNEPLPARLPRRKTAVKSSGRKKR